MSSLSRKCHGWTEESHAPISAWDLWTLLDDLLAAVIEEASWSSLTYFSLGTWITYSAWKAIHPFIMKSSNSTKAYPSGMRESEEVAGAQSSCYSAGGITSLRILCVISLATHVLHFPRTWPVLQFPVIRPPSTVVLTCGHVLKLPGGLIKCRCLSLISRMWGSVDLGVDWGSCLSKFPETMLTLLLQEHQCRRAASVDAAGSLPRRQLMCQLLWVLAAWGSLLLRLP